MWQPLGNTYRIEVARQALTDLVTNELGDDVPFAMRVFGHIEARSCRTDLEVALGALDKTSVNDFIATISPQNRSKTAIAASLALAAQDLAAVDGSKVIVLITDGEESCEGDPAAEITKLVAGDPNIRVNIVGFAVDNPALSQTFAEWAELGNGTYFDTSDADAMSAAIAQMMTVRYRVLSLQGGEIASGTVNGEPVELPPGAYTVLIESASEQRQMVIISGGQSVEVVVK